jgi:hypothetical protein
VTHLRSALEAHQRGALAQAANLYQLATESAQDRPGALRGLGVIAIQEGRISDGIDLLKQCLAGAHKL